jgi:hypothetical protein
MVTQQLFGADEQLAWLLVRAMEEVRDAIRRARFVQYRGQRCRLRESMKLEEILSFNDDGFFTRGMFLGIRRMQNIKNVHLMGGDTVQPCRQGWIVAS